MKNLPLSMSQVESWQCLAQLLSLSQSDDWRDKELNHNFQFGFLTFQV